MTIICPNCGFAHSDDDFARPLRGLVLPRLQKKLLVRLIKARGNIIAPELLVDCLWGDDSNGGPDQDLNVLRSRISKLRLAIKPLGWTICSRRFSGYWLQPLGVPTS